MESQLTGVIEVAVTRFKAGATEELLDNVVQEYPIALVYNGISHAVMMATPLDLKAFAIGFSLSEGIIANLSELYDLEIHTDALGVQIEMNIASRAFMALKQQRRALVGRTGCGLCGIESLQQFQFNLEKIAHPAPKSWLDQIPNALQQLQAQQPISALTGGAHAAAWVENGIIIATFEDVGRHNALDKLLGYLTLQQQDVRKGFVVMTSRASYELIRKCAVFNISLLATISAPTSMAIGMAQQAGLTLASFCRESGFVCYN
ncbi:formate dehydrogenase accessory sulfurtransferase FdhD [Acinetobacter sp. MD2]|uniref:formate dehydrogenase accessory sulfurtransferase FdhD n=1 Tax=Acinetobacter sp. MD2 TaxID=2600066 RepID=UPI002D1F996E|nr:formate dehydrogenase accessory sulfurtransferase FdhD [Acinetobacter sp. MD2]MEB3766696.1 formate dehydrogenase accessory sulfurtransferase FdhD [Acinetobacter sp. MD2]